MFKYYSIKLLSLWLFFGVIFLIINTKNRTNIKTWDNVDSSSTSSLKLENLKRVDFKNSKIKSEFKADDVNYLPNQGILRAKNINGIIYSEDNNKYKFASKSGDIQINNNNIERFILEGAVNFESSDGMVLLTEQGVYSAVDAIFFTDRQATIDGKGSISRSKNLKFYTNEQRMLLEGEVESTFEMENAKQNEK